MKSTITSVDPTHQPIIESQRRNYPADIKNHRREIGIAYALSLLLVDTLMLLLAFNLAYYIRFELSWSIFQHDILLSPELYIRITTVLVPAWIVIFFLTGLYIRKNLLGGTLEYSMVFRASTTALLLVILFGFLDPTFIIARGWMLMAWLFSFIFPTIGRFCLRRVFYTFRRRGYFLSPTLIVGANEEGLSLARQLSCWPTSGLRVVGFVDKKFQPGTHLFDNLSVLGPVEQLDRIIEEKGIEDLVVAKSSFTSHDNLLDIFKNYGVSKDVNIHMSSGLYEIITTGLTVKEFGYISLVDVNKVRLSDSEMFCKTVLDVVIAFFGLLILSPVLLLTALAIKLDSHGGIIHRRRVMGLNGKQFNAYKFRTMYTNGAEMLEDFPNLQEELENNHKLKEDPRVTRVGRFLRKLSLDEFPQLINVLKLQMAIVGPRMICPEEMKNYNQWGINLLTVRPGITGLWQVSGRSDIDYQERVRMDMNYIRNWSPWLDLHILVRTGPAVLSRKGAY